jgi:curved DNA-binding protein CbpA
MQNYYDVLGVSPTADDFVIKAAYKALAQRYHPDKFANNPRDAADAENKMRQLNEAYQVLSDTAKRSDYDALRQNQQHSRQESNSDAKQQADWQIALRFYPDLTTFETRLAKFDTDLVSEFRSNLLATQQYERRQAIADKLEQDYLEGYFGDHPDIVQFARELLLAGKREGAKELNQMLKVVGNSVSPHKVIDQLADKYLSGNFNNWKKNIPIGFVRWSEYVKKYKFTTEDLAYAITNNHLKQQLINEKNTEGVAYVEDKHIPLSWLKILDLFNSLLLWSLYLLVFIFLLAIFNKFIS